MDNESAEDSGNEPFEDKVSPGVAAMGTVAATVVTVQATTAVAAASAAAVAGISVDREETVQIAE